MLRDEFRLDRAIRGSFYNAPPAIGGVPSGTMQKTFKYDSEGCRLNRAEAADGCEVGHRVFPGLPLPLGLSLLCVCSLLTCLLSSCVWMKSTGQRLSEKRQTLTKQYDSELEQVQSSSQGGELEVTWEQAKEKMFLHNPNLIQADYRIVDARNRQKQVWRDMVPGISVGASDSFFIKDVGDAFADPTLRINSYLSLGNLLDLPEKVYTRKLYLIGAKLQAEYTMRQQVIALYRMFQEQSLLKLEKRAIDYEGELLSGIIDGLEGEDLLSMRTQQKEALEVWEKREKQWLVKVGDFFMDQYGKIDLKSLGLPEVSYHPKELDFTDTSRWGLLQLNLLALEQIAEDGRVLDAYFNYLPRINMSVTAPPLYSSTSSTSFDPELIRISPSLSWSLDSRGYIGQQIDRMKRSEVIKDWQKDKRRRQEIVRLLEGKEALEDIQEELTKLQAAITTYGKAVLIGLVEDPQRALQNMRRLREREVRLKAKEITICTEFWLIDEQRWKPITRRWLETREQRTKQRKKAQKSGSNPMKFWRRKKG